MFAEWKKSVHKSQDTEVRKKDPGPDLMKLTFWKERDKALYRYASK